MKATDVRASRSGPGSTVRCAVRHPDPSSCSTTNVSTCVPAGGASIGHFHDGGERFPHDCLVDIHHWSLSASRTDCASAISTRRTTPAQSSDFGAAPQAPPIRKGTATWSTIRRSGGQLFADLIAQPKEGLVNNSPIWWSTIGSPALPVKPIPSMALRCDRAEAPC
jgi:hypothetical protein